MTPVAVRYCMFIAYAGDFRIRLGGIPRLPRVDVRT